MKANKEIKVSQEEIAQFCARNHIKRLAVFGSALRGQLRPDSDIDILVEFNKENVPGFFKLIAMEEELSSLFDGRKVDLRTPKDLSRYFRHQVVEDAEVLHP